MLNMEVVDLQRVAVLTVGIRTFIWKEYHATWIKSLCEVPGKANIEKTTTAFDGSIPSFDIIAISRRLLLM